MEYIGKIEITTTNSHGDYYIGNKDKYIAIVVMDVLSSEDIAKAKAKELVRRWNAFEDGGLVEELRTALERYGEHETGCTLGDACNCGFNAALAKS